MGAAGAGRLPPSRLAALDRPRRDHRELARHPANPEAPRIACYDERVLLYGDAALVFCEEELDGGTLVASNLFVREDGAWRIAHHQAGQLVRRQAEPRRPPRLN